MTTRSLTRRRRPGELLVTGLLAACAVGVTRPVGAGSTSYAAVDAACETAYAALTKAGKDPLLDDRDDRPLRHVSSRRIWKLSIKGFASSSEHIRSTCMRA